ncbi:reverse transcriptase family protein [Microbacterium sp. Clip185]|uniref:reverse transcriptase family protein n=1 Tax=Microbacterium sp. Clip185 TaxID=3025663 RepID=UPI002365D280|nr:reverse transcriptase family protein [Microbacterium sp. Clip185]WDG17469.1 reverse transcriptase family protein [Microbacterium sp. Clip185]
MLDWDTFAARTGLLRDETRSAADWREWTLPQLRPVRFRTHRRWRESVRAIGKLDNATRIAKLLLGSDRRFADAVHGFMGGRSTVSAATPHLKAPVVLTVDLASFFQQVTFARVASSLRTQLDSDVLNWVEGCCFVDGSLPLGFRTSPRLSNIAFDSTDYDLEALSSSRGARYTRWVDDLSFSGSGVSDEFLADVRATLRRHNWQLNERKTRFMRKSPYVLGLYVGNNADRPHLPRWMKERLRVESHFYARFGRDHFRRDGVWPMGRLYGLVAYAWVVDPEFASKLESKLRQGEAKTAPLLPLVLPEDTRLTATNGDAWG